MRPTYRRLHRALSRLAVVTTTGMVFQATGCSLDPSAVAADLSSVFLNTLISGFVNDQLGVANGFFF